MRRLQEYGIRTSIAVGTVGCGHDDDKLVSRQCQPPASHVRSFYINYRMRNCIYVQLSGQLAACDAPTVGCYEVVAAVRSVRSVRTNVCAGAGWSAILWGRGESARANRLDLSRVTRPCVAPEASLRSSAGADTLGANRGRIYCWGQGSAENWVWPKKRTRAPLAYPARRSTRA